MSDIRTSPIRTETSWSCALGDHRNCTGFVGTTARKANGQAEPGGGAVIRPCACRKRECSCSQQRPTTRALEAVAETVRRRVEGAVT